MVGAAGFEPTTSSTPRKRSTKLSHAPNHKNYYTDYVYSCQRFFQKYFRFLLHRPNQDQEYDKHKAHFSLRKHPAWHEQSFRGLSSYLRTP